ncbi:glycosyltransferase [Mediterraneibacter massiliensis]|uniref:glycosyltransferase n=1 Tax=Mediterraneibacter massiliensis TaxID=1720300 RepID=UPI0024AD256B|nr:glycosyltransferase [Mediterraneibacter massiliensis]
MKIAMLTNNYRPFVGGVPVSVERQAQELIKRGHEVTVFAPEYEGYTDDNAIPERVVRFRTMKRTMENGMVYPRVFIREITDVFSREHFDMIHVHHPMFVGPCALYLGKKYRIPVVYTWHTRYEDYLHYIPFFQLKENSGWAKKRFVSYLKERLVPGYMRWFTNQCDMVFAPSEGMKEQMQSNGTWTPTAVLPTGLHEDFFRQDKERARKIREKYAGKRKYLLCTVSRLEKEKNTDFLLEGVVEIKKKLGGSFRVLFIGDGSQKQVMQKKVEKLGLQEEVLFTGNIPNEEIKDYLGASDLFLFASRSETQGIVLAEALAAGVPVVAVRAVGVDDSILDGQNGYRTAENTEKWAEKAALSLKPDIHTALKRGAILMAENYRAERIALREENLYMQCILRKQEEIRSKEKLEEGWAYGERRSRI